KS
ncbi:putative oligopeptide ABC transporter, ATP-binding protein, partial [Vibrio parahaemolyticus V-223/04]